MKKSSAVIAALLFMSVNAHAHEHKTGFVNGAVETSFVEIPLGVHDGVAIAVAAKPNCYFIIGSQKHKEDRLTTEDDLDIPPCEYDIGLKDGAPATSSVEIPIVVDDSIEVVL